jgi:hypothetical protein
MTFAWRRKKKPMPVPVSLPTGLHGLKDITDAQIMHDLDQLQYVLIPQFEQISAVSAVWIGVIHDSKEWNMLRDGTLKEIRRLDRFTEESSADMHAGIEFFYALLYHILLWNNTLKTLESWQECIRAGEGIRNMMPPTPDDKRGYA